MLSAYQSFLICDFLVAAWGTDDPQSDINNDGIVNITDILALMADWGCA
jgi:hypothetical protein